MALGQWTYNDGGRVNAGYSTAKGDCAIRAIAVATGIDYKTVLSNLTERDLVHRESWGKGKPRKPLTDAGVFDAVYSWYLRSLGWKFVPVTNLKYTKLSSLPKGTIIIVLRDHLVCAIDNVVHDTFDSFKRGSRKVYGYWINDNPTDKDQTMPIETPNTEETSLESAYNAPSASVLAYENVTGYSLFKRLDIGHTVSIGVGQHCDTYDVMSVQYDYDYEKQESIVWAVELRIVVADSVDRPSLHLPYLYLKANDNDPSWSFIDRLLPVLSGNMNGYEPDETMPDPDENTPEDSDSSIAEDMPDQNSAIDQTDSDNSKIDVHSYTVKHSKKCPITIYEPNKRNNRVIAYYVVKAYKRNPLLGKITLNGETRKVSRRMQSNGQYSQWELIH